MNRTKKHLLHTLLVILILLIALFILGDTSFDQVTRLIPRVSQTAAVADFNSSLVAHYTFDDGTATDSAGSHNGTLVGGPTSVAGKVGSGALQFDGSASHVKISSGVIPAGPATVCAWIYPQGSSSSIQSIVDNVSQFQLAIYSGALFLNGTSGHVNSSNNAISSNAWYFVCGTLDAAGVGMVYVNGSPSASGSIGSSASSAWNVGIGVRGTLSAQFFNGAVDDVRVYSVVLPAEAIASLYTEGSPGSTVLPPPTSSGSSVPPTSSGNTPPANQPPAQQPPQNSNNFTSCGTDCYLANTVSVVDIQAAIDASQMGNGGVVRIPAGTGTFTTPIKKTITKNLIVTGAGRGQTIINDALNDNPGNATSIFQFSVNSGVLFHLKSMKLVKAFIGQNSKAFIILAGASFKILVSDIYFEQSDASDGSERGIFVAHDNDPVAGGGVIFDNYFNKTGSRAQSVSIDGSLVSRTWTLDRPEWGSPNKWYVEDNYFNYIGGPTDGAVDAYTNANIVVRYNTVVGTNIGWHGYDSSVISPQTEEVYKNTFVTNGNNNIGLITDRGGTAVIWGNRVDDKYYTGSLPVAPIINLSYYRSTNNWNGMSGKGQCNGTRGIQGSPSPSYIFNGADGVLDSTGWPCYQQPGTTGKNGVTPWPVIGWDNITTPSGKKVTFGLNGNFIPPLYSLSPNGTDHIKEGRDYLNDTTCSDGIDHAGLGVNMANPICATFWDSASKSAKGYTPLAYPHPLRSNPNYTSSYVPVSVINSPVIIPPVTPPTPPVTPPVVPPLLPIVPAQLPITPTPPTTPAVPSLISRILPSFTSPTRTPTTPSNVTKPMMSGPFVPLPEATPEDIASSSERTSFITTIKDILSYILERIWRGVERVVGR